MYNAWWIAVGASIGIGITIIIPVVFAILKKIFESKKDLHYSEWCKVRYDYSDKSRDEKYDAYLLWQSKYDKVDVSMLCDYVVMGIFGCILFLTLLIGGINVACTKDEYNQFVETQVMVEQIYNGDGYTEYENAGINNKIIEMNQWLVKAKTSKKQWGNWSVYCMFDIDSLDYIVLVKGDGTNGKVNI